MTNIIRTSVYANYNTYLGICLYTTQDINSIQSVNACLPISIQSVTSSYDSLTHNNYVLKASFKQLSNSRFMEKVTHHYSHLQRSHCKYFTFEFITVFVMFYQQKIESLIFQSNCTIYFIFFTLSLLRIEHALLHAGFLQALSLHSCRSVTLPRKHKSLLKYYVSRYLLTPLCFSDLQQILSFDTL